MGLEPLNRVTPLRGSGLADGILITEQPDLVDGFLGGDGVEPIHLDKIFGFLGIVCSLPVFLSMLEHIETGTLALRGLDHEVLRTLNGFLDDADTYIPCLRDIRPNPVPWGQERQRPTIPTTASRADEAIF